MAKKPKLSQALANYTKKQVVKAKYIRSLEAKMSSHNSSKSAKATAAAEYNLNGPKKTTKVVVQSPVDNHVPCHVWTDTANMQVRTKIPFHPEFNSVIVLIGEGDFSYCRALVECFEEGSRAQDEETRAWKIIATTLDSKENVLRKYRKAQDNLDFFAEEQFKDRVSVLFEVDGTALHEDRDLKRALGVSTPTRIIFNFPHTGAGIKDRERNIVAQQKMLSGFFDSAIKFMHQRNSGMFFGNNNKKCTYSTTTMKKDYVIKEGVTVLKVKSAKKGKKKGKDVDDDEHSGSDYEMENMIDNANTNVFNEFDSEKRGELLEIHCTFKTGDPYDAWNPKKLAHRTGQLECLQTFRFVPELYPGYQHCRTIGERDERNGEEVISADGWKEFLAGKPAKTFVFTMKPPKAPAQPAQSSE